MEKNKKISTLNRIFKNEIRLDLLFESLWRLRKKFIKPMLILFLVFFAYFWTLPRFYTAKILLAPEYSSGSSMMSNSGIGNLASLAGFDMGNMNTDDAITPYSYPSVMHSTNFIVKLFDIKVQTLDGVFNDTYYNYLARHQKIAPIDWIKYIIAKSIKWIKNLFITKKEASGSNIIDPFHLSKDNFLMVECMKGMVSCDIDKKTGILTINTVAQDPLVVAQLADSVKEKLQLFITDYRTKKARLDLKYFRTLNEAAKKNYHVSQKKYSSYVDSHRNVVLETVRIQEENLRNEMQLAFDAYMQTAKQVQIYEAKVQERTPAFSTIQNVTVPIKPSGPKRLIGLVIILFLGFIVIGVFLLSKDNIETMEKTEDSNE